MTTNATPDGREARNIAVTYGPVAPPDREFEPGTESEPAMSLIESGSAGA